MEKAQREENAPANADQETNGVDAAAAAPAEGAAEGTAAPTTAEEDEEAKQMTLEEYEAVLAEKRAGLNKEAKTRQVDTKAFEGMQVRQARKDKEDEEDVLTYKKGKGPKQVREKPLKERETVETSFRIADDNAGGGFRGRGRGRGRGEGSFRGSRGGDRGEGRGGEGRGDRPYGGDRPFRGRGGYNGGRGEGGRGEGGRGYGGRGPAGPAGNINVDDQSAFPTLGGGN
jgi:plasminogen activator inhibitor 1 RNA-binding protein